MDFRKMKYFMAVAEEQNFTRASEKLYVAQSSLSEQIQRLEEELNCTLLVRSKRGAELTDQGKLFYNYCSRALNDYEEVVRKLQAKREVLRLGIYDHARLDQWIAEIETYNSQCGTQIQYSYVYSNDVAHRLKNAELDMGLDFQDTELQEMGFQSTPAYILRLGLYTRIPQSEEQIRTILVADETQSREVAKASLQLLETMKLGSKNLVRVATLEEMMFQLLKPQTAAVIFDYVAAKNDLLKLLPDELDMPVFWYTRRSGPAVDWVRENLK